MKVYFYFTSIVVLAVLFLSGCCKECSDPTNPDCENYDPCHNSEPANADFTINEQINFTDFYYETDTIYSVNGTLFKPKYEADSITWLLGSEVVNEKELFRKGYPLGTIEVTMIAKMNPTSCLTEEQRVDTVTKQFFVLPYSYGDTTKSKELPWWGTWEGYNADTPLDKFLVTFGYIWGVSPENRNVAFDFSGLPKGIKTQVPFYTNSVDRSWAIDVRVGYKALRLFNIQGREDNWIGGGFALEGTCYRNGNDITIEYSYNNTPYQHWLNGEDRQAEPIVRVNRTFIAAKISNQVLTEE